MNKNELRQVLGTAIKCYGLVSLALMLVALLSVIGECNTKRLTSKGVCTYTLVHSSGVEVTY